MHLLSEDIWGYRVIVVIGVSPTKGVEREIFKRRSHRGQRADTSSL